jgi:hypothetical protein
MRMFVRSVFGGSSEDGAVQAESSKTASSGTMVRVMDSSAAEFHARREEREGTEYRVQRKAAKDLPATDHWPVHSDPMFLMNSV